MKRALFVLLVVVLVAGFAAQASAATKPGTCSFTLRTISASTGQNIEGAAVAVDVPQGRRSYYTLNGVTNAAGEVTFSNLPATSLLVTVRKAPYYPAYVSIDTRAPGVYFVLRMGSAE